MRSRSINLQLLCAVIALVFFITCPEAFAQDKTEKANKAVAKTRTSTFCSNDDNWNGDNKVQHKELREMTVAASGALNVDGGKNGGISVKGENRTDILVRACVQAWGKSAEEAQSLVKGVRVDTGSTIKAEGSADENWGVSYQILVPRNTDLNLTAHNGGISIYGVEGNLDFKTLNGGLHLSEIAGNVKGRTTNGGVHVELSGGSWKGNGLDLETTNGGVHLSVPQNFAAHFETGTVNGGFHSSFSQLELPKSENGERRRPGGRVTADLNGGGAPIRLITTNGGVHIGADKDDEE
jgi:Putative adhesin